MHRTPTPYFCQKCDRYFTQGGNFRKHMNTHMTQKKRHSCEICQRSFTRRGDLTRHKRTHSGEKPFACADCGKKFAYSYNLRTHMNTHTSSKPYACSFCTSSFSQKGKLTVHLKLHSVKGPQDCTCAECSLVFDSAQMLQLHMSTHTVSVHPRSTPSYQRSRKRSRMPCLEDTILPTPQKLRISEPCMAEHSIDSEPDSLSVSDSSDSSHGSSPLLCSWRSSEPVLPLKVGPSCIQPESQDLGMSKFSLLPLTFADRPHYLDYESSPHFSSPHWCHYEVSSPPRSCVAPQLPNDGLLTMKTSMWPVVDSVLGPSDHSSTLPDLLDSDCFWL